MLPKRGAVSFHSKIVTCEWKKLPVWLDGLLFASSMSPSALVQDVAMAVNFTLQQEPSKTPVLNDQYVKKYSGKISSTVVHPGIAIFTVLACLKTSPETTRP